MIKVLKNQKEKWKQLQSPPVHGFEIFFNIDQKFMIFTLIRSIGSNKLLATKKRYIGVKNI